ncbi:MAG TPA: GtrA family protein [Solirubrobacteraceae bacterium]|nr:GtrA family protein [Solirubrobacteraceae bacterium]
MPARSESSRPRFLRACAALAERIAHPVAVQFVKFGIVGVSNTLLTFLVYTLLLKVFGVWYLAASAIGFIVGTTNSFLLNRRWTFAEHVGDSMTPVRWAVVQGCGLGLNLALLALFVGGAGLDELLGQGVATVIVTVSTFFANRHWTFPIHDAPEPLAAGTAQPAPTGTPGSPASPESPVAGSAKPL